MKIRASYGLVGSDVAAGNRYLYEQVYQENGNYPFGDYPADSPVIKEGDLGTPSVTWEKAKKFDVGLDMIYLIRSHLLLTTSWINVMTNW